MHNDAPAGQIRNDLALGLLNLRIGCAGLGGSKPQTEHRQKREPQTVPSEAVRGVHWWVVRGSIVRLPPGAIRNFLRLARLDSPRPARFQSSHTSGKIERNIRKAKATWVYGRQRASSTAARRWKTFFRRTTISFVEGRAARAPILRAPICRTPI